MESKRLWIGLALWGLLTLLWLAVIAPRIWPPPPPAPPKKPPPAKAAPAPEPVKPNGAVATPVEPRTPPKFTEERHTLETPVLKVDLTSKGAGILRAVRRYPDPTSDVPLLEPREARWPHLALRHLGGDDELESVAWKVAEARPGEFVEYVYPMSNRVEVRKRIGINSTDHTIVMTLWLKNLAPAGSDGKVAPQPVTLELLAFNGLEHDSSYRYEQYFKGFSWVDKDIRYFEYPVVEKAEAQLIEARKKPEGKARDEAIRAIEKEFHVESGHKRWFGIKNRFFGAILEPDKDALDRLKDFRFAAISKDAQKAAGNLKNLVALARTDEIRVTDREVAMKFTAYLGPIQRKSLSAVQDAWRLLDYGGGCASGCFLGPLAWPVVELVRLVAPAILGLLKFTSGIFGNYGVGIIVTTLLIRLLVFPLSRKAQVSAQRMSELGPKIKALQERYKDDRQKLGVEQMRLFKEHKINPMSGCLPVVLQLPIFIAMFSVFELSIELRQAPFMLWIRDLSQPDRLFSWTPVSFWLLFGTVTIEGLNLLPILMMITWFFQAYLAPRSPDPQMAAQQKMMMAMPFIFGLACYGYAAGLSLYFLVNSLLAMVEQKLIKKYFLKPSGPVTAS